MNQAARAEQSLLDGDPDAALQYLQEAVKSNPADAKLRIFLFQLLSVFGQWERALNQLEVIGEMDVAALAMVHMYRDALHCEALREKVFNGQKSPMIFGMPEQWLAFLVEAHLLAGQGNAKESQKFRSKAFEDAPPSSGTVDGRSFNWIADADMRLGPVVEAIINGRYYWIPFVRLTRIAIDPPQDLRDIAWTPAHLRFDNGEESVALIPTRYPGTQASSDGQLLMAKKTMWEEAAPGMYYGYGQRILTTDNGEIPLMDVREILLDDIQLVSHEAKAEAVGRVHG